MAPAGKASPRQPRNGAGLYTVTAIKLGKGLLLLALAVGIFSLADNDLPRELEALLRALHQDPAHEFWAALAAKLETLTPAGVRSLASGTLLYALLLFVEGLGLLGGCGWAVWLAIGETAFFIPIEVLDLLHRFRWGIAAILAANMLIVAWLVRYRHRWFKHGGPGPAAAPAEPAADADPGL